MLSVCTSQWQPPQLLQPRLRSLFIFIIVAKPIFKLRPNASFCPPAGVQYDHYKVSVPPLPSAKTHPIKPDAWHLRDGRSSVTPIKRASQTGHHPREYNRSVGRSSRSLTLLTTQTFLRSHSPTAPARQASAAHQPRAEYYGLPV